MTTPGNQRSPSAKWFWALLIVALGIIALLIFVRPVGDAGEDVRSTTASATVEERMSTELDVAEDQGPAAQPVISSEDTD